MVWAGNQARVAGVHPGNPFPKPDNWIELSRLVQWDVGDAAPLLRFPWTRRYWFLKNGETGTIALAELADMPAFVPSGDPEVAAQQASRIDAYESQIRSGRSGWPTLVLQVADGATAADAVGGGKPDLVLEAYRRVRVARLQLQLFWPKAVDRFLWFVTMTRGTPTQIETAFKTGVLPSLRNVG